MYYTDYCSDTGFACNDCLFNKCKSTVDRLPIVGKKMLTPYSHCLSRESETNKWLNLPRQTS